MSHAKFAPSAAYMWLRCPLSVRLAEQYPSTTSAAAAEGTRQHEVAAQHLIDGTESDERPIQLYLDTVRQYPGELLVEQRVVVAEGLCWGTADAVVLGPERVVADYKSGRHRVSPVSNPQLMLYALGLLRETPLPREAYVRLIIVQPNASSGWPVRHWQVGVQALLSFRCRVLTAIERALAPNPPAMAGEHCYFCPAKLHCPEHLFSVGAKKSLNYQGNSVS